MNAPQALQQMLRDSVEATTELDPFLPIFKRAGRTGEIIRDPQEFAIAMEVPPLLAIALGRLGFKEDARPLLLTPATRRCQVIDATSDAFCGVCGRSCWISPSSKATHGWTHIVCMACCERAVGMEPQA